MLPHPARSLPGSLLSRQTAAAVAAIADPARAAVHALTALLEASPRYLCGLPATALNTTPSVPWLMLGETEIPVPPPAWPVLRTYHCYLRHQRHRHNTGLDCDTDTGPLWCHQGRRAAVQTVQALLRETPEHWITDDGLPMAIADLRHPYCVWPRQWLRSRALRLHSHLLGVS